jgi:antitoxin MazE
MANKTATLTVQKWGNSLAVRIPSSLARSVHFHSGTLVELAVQEGSIVVKPTGGQKLTLDEKLAAFDPKKHGGEVMASKNVGVEKF